MDASNFLDLLPTESGFRINNVEFEHSSIVVELHTTAPSAVCPKCQSDRSPFTAITADDCGTNPVGATAFGFPSSPASSLADEPNAPARCSVNA